MIGSTDQTHDPSLPCWVPSAANHPEFPVQNLPLGIFSPAGGAPRAGVAIGDMIIDLRALHSQKLIDEAAQEACGLCLGETLNRLLAQGAEPRRALRYGVSALLAGNTLERPGLLHPQHGCTMHLPVAIGDFTDFYAGIHHATNIGRLFRPDNPLLPNYKHVPIAYHGRASSVRPTGVPVRRPRGQMKPAISSQPIHAASARLDYEVELGAWITGGNAPGTTIPIGKARDQIAGLCLLNDWSARDIQAWEYQPLGPFLAKSFQTTVSPWIVTAEALAPFRVAQPTRLEGDPRPLDYLWDVADQREGALSLSIEARLLTAGMRATGLSPALLSHARATAMYWTLAQMVTHHASNGCDLRAGDLIGTGTISGETEQSCGSLIEITVGGARSLRLPNGETRTFLEDGDEVILSGRLSADGFVSIGFGECRARVMPATS